MTQNPHAASSHIGAMKLNDNKAIGFTEIGLILKNIVLIHVGYSQLKWAL